MLSLPWVVVDVVGSLDIDGLLYSASLGALRVDDVLEVVKALVTHTASLNIYSWVSRG